MPNAGELTDEVVDSFLPWSDRVPESCKLDPAAAEKAKEMPDDFIINIDPDAFDVACRRIEDAQRMQDMFAHEVRDAYEMTQQQADLLEGA